MTKGKLHIGTSGWHYPHWKAVFYPDNLRNEQQLSYYAQEFTTVEINNSFYHLPSAETFRTWAAAVPEKFLFAVKGSRFFTHMKKLNLTKADLQPFFKQISNLKKKLGPVLFQLPPFWKINTGRLEAFLKILPRNQRYSFEFRNATWYDDQVYTLLKKYHCAFCIYDLDRQLSPMITTADFDYIRLHGPAGKYQGKYTASVLNTWLKRCRAWQDSGKDVYLYFDNDQAGYAVKNAQMMLRKSL